MGKTRVLVADDSGLMRLLVSDILEKSDSDIEVIDTACNGLEAFELTKKHKPDVVLLDMNMGEYDGNYAVEHIMKECPTPIIILSSVGNQNMDPILKALKMGALDYLNKPEKNSSRIRDIESELVKKVAMAGGVEVKELVKSKVSKNVNEHSFREPLPYSLIVVGSSTGGPTAIEKLLLRLPSNLPIPVIIAQHMPANFISSFVNRLNDMVPLRVIQARLEETLTPGTVYVAPGNRNITLRDEGPKGVKIAYTSRRYEAFNFPSVDAIMEAAAEIYGNQVIGVILTGMGKDGSMGLKAIKDKGGYTIAQDEKTSVVWGMPGEVSRKGIAMAEVPIDEMGNYIVGCLA